MGGIKMMNDFSKLIEKVEKDDSSKRDFNEYANQLRINSQGRLVRKSHEGREGLQFSQYAFTQLLNRYKLNVRETKAMVNTNPRQVYGLLNELMSADSGQVLIRARVIRGRGVIRAILSENYSMLNNTQIVNSLAQTLEHTKLSPKIETSFIDDGRAHIRITFDPTKQAFGKDIAGTDDIIKSGVDILNSETGRSSLRIEPLVYRQVCTNGLKAWTGDTENESFNQRHIFISTEELNKLVFDGINGSVSTANKIAKEFEETKKIVVDSPVSLIKELCEDNKYSKKLTNKIINAFVEEPMNSRYGVVNAFTRGARDLSNYQRLEVEKFAGRLLTDETLYEKVA